MSRKQDFEAAETVLGWVRGPKWGNGNGEWIIDGKPYKEHHKSFDSTPLFSSDIVAAFQLRDVIAKQIFSVRLRFTNALQRIISERLDVKPLLHESGIILHVTAEDICRAAVEAMKEAA